MVFCLFISILSILLYFNILVAEIVNSKNGVNVQNENQYNNSIILSKIKFILLIIFSIFISNVIYYW